MTDTPDPRPEHPESDRPSRSHRSRRSRKPATADGSAPTRKTPEAGEPDTPRPTGEPDTVGQADDPGTTGAPRPAGAAGAADEVGDGGDEVGDGGDGGMATSGSGAGASRGGDPGRPVRASGGGRRRSAPASRTTGDAGDAGDDTVDAAGPDPAESYLAAYLDAVERGDEPPDLDELDPTARADVEAVLALIGGAGGDAEAGDRPAHAAHARADDDTGTGDEPELRPLGESEFAVEHGLSRTNPDVVVSGPAVRRARAVAGMTTVDVAEEMARRGDAVAAEAVEALEQRTAHRMTPRDARLLAAVLDLPLDTIEAVAVPWSADPAALAELAGAGASTDADHDDADDDHVPVRPIVLGDDVVLRTGTGSHLGVLRCAGGADVLDSRTYRQAAATRLVGPWSQLAGALLVADEAPHLALAVDALDCVARQHAPSGLIGFSRLAEPETVARALASYDRAYAIDWSDPDPLEGLATRPDQAARALAGRIEALAERLADEARRSRQTGKRPGYAAAAGWLRSTPAAEMVALLDELAHAEPDEARRRIDELTEVVLA
jgi:hypothetical protein